MRLDAVKGISSDTEIYCAIFVSVIAAAAIIISPILATAVCLIVCAFLLAKDQTELLLVGMVMLTTSFGWLFRPIWVHPIYYVNFILLPVILVKMVLKREIEFSKWDWLVAGFLILPIVSLIKTALYDGQPVLFGLKLLRYDALILFYFCFKSKVISVKMTMNAILLFGFFSSFLILYAVVTKNHYLYTIANVAIENRLGSNRFRIADPVIIFCSIYFIYNYLIGKKWLDGFCSLYYLFIIIFCMQTRGVITAVLISTAYVFILLAPKKLLAITVLCTVALFISFFQLGIETSTFNKLLNVTSHELQSSSTSVNSFSARKIAHGYYASEWLKHPVLGSGRYWYDSSSYLSQYQSVNLSAALPDVGLVSVVYCYGFFGVCWLIAFLVFVARFCNIALLNNKTGPLFQFMLFVLFGGLTTDFVTYPVNEVFFFVLLSLLVRQLNTTDLHESGAFAKCQS